MVPFSVELMERPPAVVLRLKGEARTDVSALDMQAAGLPARHPPIVVLDMAKLTFCASIGMRAIVALQRSLDRAGGKTRLAAVQPDVLDLFKRAVILPLFEVFPTVEDALAAPITPKATPTKP